MDCAADGLPFGSCSSQATWLSACDASQCRTGSTRLSTATADTHFTSASDLSSSDGSTHSGRQRCGAPSVDVVAIARERLAAALEQGGSAPQQRHAYAYGIAPQPTPADQPQQQAPAPTAANVLQQLDAASPQRRRRSVLRAA